MYEHSVVVARVVVVRFQVLFVEINEVTIAYETDYDISGFIMDGRAHAVAVIRPRYVDVVTRSLLTVLKIALSVFSFFSSLIQVYC